MASGRSGDKRKGSSSLEKIIVAAYTLECTHTHTHTNTVGLIIIAVDV